MKYEQDQPCTPLITVFDKDSNHTAVYTEECFIQMMYFEKTGKSFVVVKNSQGNLLNVPLNLFEDTFALGHIHS